MYQSPEASAADAEITRTKNASFMLSSLTLKHFLHLPNHIGKEVV